MERRRRGRFRTKKRNVTWNKAPNLQCSSSTDGVKFYTNGSHQNMDDESIMCCQGRPESPPTDPCSVSSVFCLDLT